MNVFRYSFALAGVALSLAACSSDQVASGPTTNARLAGVICPPAGTLATRDNGTRVRYMGADPADPAVCLMRTPEGTSRVVGGLVATHPVNDAARRQALASLFPLAEGKTSRVRYPLVPATPGYQTVPFEESFRVVGERPFEMEDGARPAWVVEGNLRGMMDGSVSFNSVYNIDKATGVVLSQTTTSPTGALTARPFRVTELVLPTR